MQRNRWRGAVGRSGSIWETCPCSRRFLYSELLLGWGQRRSRVWPPWRSVHFPRLRAEMPASPLQLGTLSS